MGSSWTRAGTHIPYIGRQVLNHCTTREALKCAYYSSLGQLEIAIPPRPHHWFQGDKGTGDKSELFYLLNTSQTTVAKSFIEENGGHIIPCLVDHSSPGRWFSATLPAGSCPLRLLGCPLNDSPPGTLFQPVRRCVGCPSSVLRVITGRHIYFCSEDQFSSLS